MASSTIGQDEPNPLLWLATQAAKMGLSCPFALALFLCIYDLNYVSVHKHTNKDLANNQPSKTSIEI